MRVLFPRHMAQKVGASNVDISDIAQVLSSRACTGPHWKSSMDKPSFAGTDEQFFVHTDGPLQVEGGIAMLRRCTKSRIGPHAKIQRRRAQCFLTLVHFWVTMFHVKFSEKSVGKVNPLRTSCMSAFSRSLLFWNCKNLKNCINLK